MKTTSIAKIIKPASILLLDGLFVGVITAFDEVLSLGASWDASFAWSLKFVILASIAAHAYLVGFRASVLGSSKSCHRFSAFFAGACAIPYVFLFFQSMRNAAHENPFVALVMIFLPVFVVFYIGIYFYLGWGLWVFSLMVQQKGAVRRVFLLGPAIAYICLLMSAGGEICTQLRQRHVINTIASLKSNELHQLMLQPDLIKSPWILNAMLCNSYLSSEDLRIVASLTDTKLHRYRRPLFAPDSCNTDGMPTMYLVVVHENVTPDVLNRLKESPNRHVSEFAGRDELNRSIARDCSRHTNSALTAPELNYLDRYLTKGCEDPNVKTKLIRLRDASMSNSGCTEKSVARAAVEVLPPSRQFSGEQINIIDAAIKILEQSQTSSAEFQQFFKEFRNFSVRRPSISLKLKIAQEEWLADHPNHP
jgi:hypothetical protein